MATTETLEKPAPIANFLQVDIKKIDWRFQTWDHLCNISHEHGAPRNATIYWIGTIDLISIREAEHQYPMFFTDWHNRLVDDKKQSRDIDGAPIGSQTTVPYDLGDILSTLLKARGEGFNYFHVFLEETVDTQGRHSIVLLYGKNTENYGIAAKTPWVEMPVKKWLRYSEQKIDDNLQRIALVINGRYYWQK